MRLEDMLKNVSGITNRVIKENCWEGQFNVLEGIQVLQSKINEIILAINNGIIKGDKGDTPNVQVGSTETLEPGNNASVTQTGDILNPILNFSIPKGDKGDKGDTGKASESIQDNIVGLDTCWSSQKTVGYVDNMFNSLQDVKGVKYTSDKDYFVASGSKNGVVKDLNISGKSLVNRFPKLPGINITSNGFDSWVKMPINWDNGSTIINCSDKVILANLNRGSEYVATLTLQPNTPQFISYGTDVKISQIVGQSNYGWLDSNKTQLQNILVLEGDCRNFCPRTYFEGIASVGNGNEIEVSSRKEDGNLFDGELLDGLYNTSTGVFEPNSDVKCNKNKIAIFANRKIKLSQPLTGGSYRVFYYNIKGDYLESQLITSPYTFTPNVNARYINFQIAKSHYKDRITLNYDGFNSFEYKQDKKPILFKDTDNQWKNITNLRGIDENRCDIVDSAKGKYYKKINTKTLIGNESWQIGQDTGTCVHFNTTDPIADAKLSSKVLCDKFNYASDFTPDKECITITGSGRLIVKILKNKLDSVDSGAFNRWLQNNNTNLIYESKTIEEYLTNPTELESYSNETMILFNYGLVNGSSEFYIDSNLGSITLENMGRLSRIENEIYQVKKLVLNGDFRTLAQSTYPEDFKEVVKYE